MQKSYIRINSVIIVSQEKFSVNSYFIFVYLKYLNFQLASKYLRTQV